MEIQIRDEDFQFILEFIESETGIVLAETGYRHVRDFLTGRLKSLDKDSRTYLHFLQTEHTEYERFLDAITIGETYFFREEKQFAVLDNTIIPEMSNQQTPVIHIWSAACSSGEEALSVAAFLNKHSSRWQEKDYRIYATDVNPAVLNLFKTGAYKRNAFRKDGQKYRHLLDAIGENRGGAWYPGPGIMQHITIRRLNLNMELASDFPCEFQLILLRNALMYMRMNTRLKIIDRIVKRLAEGGCLFLSAAETALVAHPDLLLTEKNHVYFFRKKSNRNAVKPLIKSSYKEVLVFQDEYEKKIFKDALSVKDISLVAEARAANALFHDSHDVKIQAAEDFLGIIAQLNSGNGDKARESLKILEAKVEPNEITFYLYGYLDMNDGNKQTAVMNFRKAVLLNNGFWPARFYLARLLTAESPQLAKNEFLLCKKYILDYIDKNSSLFGFLLEEFNAQYFAGLCDKWLDWIAGRMPDGH